MKSALNVILILLLCIIKVYAITFPKAHKDNWDRQFIEAGDDVTNTKLVSSNTAKSIQKPALSYDNCMLLEKDFTVSKPDLNISVVFNGYSVLFPGWNFALSGSNRITGFKVDLNQTANSIGGYSSIPFTWNTFGTVSGTVDLVFSYPAALSNSSMMNVYQRYHTNYATEWKFVGIYNLEKQGKINTITVPGVASLSSQKNESVDWTLTEIEQVKSVVLNSFTAELKEKPFVCLEWVTQSETKELGFNVFRGRVNDVKAANRVNASLINATNTTYEHNYIFIDVDNSVDDSLYYWLQDVNSKQEITFHGPVIVHSKDAVLADTMSNKPSLTSLQRVNPNPSNSEALITYGVARKGKVIIDIYNTKGKKVKNLLSVEKDIDNYMIAWDGKDLIGHSCEAGVYIVEMKAGNVRSALKTVWVK